MVTTAKKTAGGYLQKNKQITEVKNMSNVSSSNQHTSDERESLCWDLYVESIANGTPNAYQSAIQAGYSQSHAENITLQGWFKERLQKLKRRDLLSKAEKVLDETLEMDDTEPILVEGEVIDRKRNPALTKIKQDSAKFLAERLGKEEGYSTRHEMTGKNGENLEPLVVVNYGDIKPPETT